MYSDCLLNLADAVEAVAAVRRWLAAGKLVAVDPRSSPGAAVARCSRLSPRGLRRWRHTEPLPKGTDSFRLPPCAEIDNINR